MDWKKELKAGLSKLFAPRPSRSVPDESAVVSVNSGEWQPRTDGAARICSGPGFRITEYFNFDAQQCTTVVRNTTTGTDTINVKLLSDVDPETLKIAAAVHRGSVDWVSPPKSDPVPDPREIFDALVEKGMATEQPVVIGRPLRLQLPRAVQQ